jgi:hypothetical protein
MHSLIRNSTSEQSPLARRQSPLALVLMAIVMSGCAGAEAPTWIAPRLTPSSDTLGVRSTMAPVATVPVGSLSSSAPKSFRFRHRYDQTVGWPSALFLVNGKAVGRRSDGTVDSAATLRWLQSVDARQIVSIEVVKGDEAIKRFGPDARGGAVLINTMADTSRAWNWKP